MSILPYAFAPTYLALPQTEVLTLSPQSNMLKNVSRHANFEEQVEQIRTAFPDIKLAPCTTQHNIRADLSTTLKNLDFIEIKAKYTYKVATSFQPVAGLIALQIHPVPKIDIVNLIDIIFKLLFRSTSLLQNESQDDEFFQAFCVAYAFIRKRQSFNTKQSTADFINEHNVNCYDSNIARLDFYEKATTIALFISHIFRFPEGKSYTLLCDHLFKFYIENGTDFIIRMYLIYLVDMFISPGKTVPAISYLTIVKNEPLLSFDQSVQTAQLLSRISSKDIFPYQDKRNIFVNNVATFIDSFLKSETNSDSSLFVLEELFKATWKPRSGSCVPFASFIRPTIFQKYIVCYTKNSMKRNSLFFEKLLLLRDTSDLIKIDTFFPAYSKTVPYIYYAITKIHPYSLLERVMLFRTLQTVFLQEILGLKKIQNSISGIIFAQEELPILEQISSRSCKGIFRLLNIVCTDFQLSLHEKIGTMYEDKKVDLNNVFIKEQKEELLHIFNSCKTVLMYAYISFETWIFYFYTFLSASDRFCSTSSEEIAVILHEFYNNNSVFSTKSKKTLFINSTANTAFKSSHLLDKIFSKLKQIDHSQPLNSPQQLYLIFLKIVKKYEATLFDCAASPNFTATFSKVYSKNAKLTWYARRIYARTYEYVNNLIDNKQLASTVQQKATSSVTKKLSIFNILRRIQYYRKYSIFTSIRSYRKLKIYYYCITSLYKYHTI